MEHTRALIMRSGPLETLFSGNATAKILDFLISSQEWDYSESDIARNSGVSIRTIQREIFKLLEFKLIKHTRTIGNAKMYQLDKSNKTGEQTAKLASTLAQIRIHKELRGKKKWGSKEISVVKKNSYLPARSNDYYLSEASNE